jgi:hypothetical protein
LIRPNLAIIQIPSVQYLIPGLMYSVLNILSPIYFGISYFESQLIQDWLFGLSFISFLFLVLTPDIFATIAPLQITSKLVNFSQGVANDGWSTCCFPLSNALYWYENLNHIHLSMVYFVFLHHMLEYMFLVFSDPVFSK